MTTSASRSPRVSSVGVLVIALVASVFGACAHARPRADPEPCGLDDVLSRRRSVRTFSPRSIEPERVARLLWAAQGLTDDGGRRTAPSAGALYPLELYVVQASGVFHYVPARSPQPSSLVRVAQGDRRGALAAAALGQAAVASAAVDIVITAVLSRTRAKYGDRAERFALLEAGHAAQNALLEATALGLGAVPIGAFDDDAVARAIDLPSGESALYVVAAGERE